VLVSTVAKDIIKPNRVGEPEAGQGTEGGRFTDSTDDSRPMNLDDQGDRCIVRMFRPENPSRDDGMIDPTLGRYDRLSSLDIPNIVIGMWEAVDERRW
jgi:hypothetical protein